MKVNEKGGRLVVTTDLGEKLQADMVIVGREPLLIPISWSV